MEIETKIKIKDLINYPFPIQKQPVDLCNLEYIINNLGLNIEYYDLDAEKFNPELFQIREIYDNPHDSDESSYRYLLFFKGEFACIYGYTGDRGTETVLFATMEKKIALREYFLSLMPEYNDTNDILEEEVELSDQYTLFFQYKDEFYYSIFSPYWSYCFGKNEPLYLLEQDDETIVPVTFIKFKLENRNILDKFDKKNHFMIVQQGGCKVEVPFERIMFKVEKEK